MNTLHGLVNVAHVANARGTACARCDAPIGEHVELNEDTRQLDHHPWAAGQIVLEILDANNRPQFVDSAEGPRMECLPA